MKIRMTASIHHRGKALAQGEVYDFTPEECAPYIAAGTATPALGEPTSDKSGPENAAAKAKAEKR